MDFFIWAFDPDNSVAVAGLSLWVTGLGFILTFGAVILTYNQSRRAQSAAEAAKTKAESIQSDLARFELATEATNADTSLAAARNYVREGMFSPAADSYEKMRHSLEAIKGEVEDLPAEMMERIDETCEYVRILCDRIEKDRQKQNSSISIPKTVSVMTEQRILVNEIIKHIQKGIVQ